MLNDVRRTLVRLLECKFPNLKLNVGSYYFRFYLTEPPGGEVYEVIDGICPFQIVRSDESPLWGWRPDACAYHEDFEWSVLPIRG